MKDLSWKDDFSSYVFYIAFPYFIGFLHALNNLPEFLLLYEDVRSSDDPRKMLVECLYVIYNAAENPADWDHQKLKRT